MTAIAHNVVSFFKARHYVRDWDNAELAQFYRVESALRQAGIFVDTERGLTDEGDPWFVFCRQDSGEVFLHIARLDGLYLVASPSMPTPLWRRSFGEILSELARENPVLLPQQRRPSTELYIHPSTLLIAAVAALFYKSAPIRSDDQVENPLRQSEARGAQSHGLLSDVYSAALVSAMAIIAVLHHTHSDEVTTSNDKAEELAFLDGILFDSRSHDELPRFEGNVGSSGVVDGALASDAELATSDGKLVDGSAETHADAASLLKDMFASFASNIVSGATAAPATATMAIAKQESDVVHDEGQAPSAGGAGSSSVVIAEAAKAAAKPAADDTGASQQVSLAAPAIDVDKGVVKVASAVTTPVSLFPEPVHQAEPPKDVGTSGGPTPVPMEPPVVVVEEPVVPTVGGLGIIQGPGMAVLYEIPPEPPAPVIETQTPVVETPPLPAVPDSVVTAIIPTPDDGIFTLG
ncbi:hypothetical protein [Arvimicrobium flavum]|uniref:hypothetical protein n=1 Tax=Arvimicrobium flavum TaxID=3393320 RepID=UPI00237AE6CC|nr:hypothetical protein [Mesorhizobium shangrilense]